MGWVCESCVGENPDGFRFCGHCGTRRAAADPVRDAGRALQDAFSSSEQQRRLVTAVFADISGFTSLSERLEPELVAEIIDPVLAALGDVVARYDGFINKYAGDALLVLFGAPVTHEDDAARALLAAEEMHRELERVKGFLGPNGAQLSLHVGVNTGHAVARAFGSDLRIDYSVLGDCVNTAQRIEASAGAGETYVGTMTYELTKDGFDFEPVGELTLKGKASGVQAWRLIGRRRTLMPSVLERAPVQLLGREEEIAAASAVLTDLLGGQGGLLSVTGEPGAGKSRLIREIASHFRRQVTFLEARCLPYGATLAYWPYADLLRRWFELDPDMSPEVSIERLERGLLRYGLSHTLPFLARLLGLPAGASGVEIADFQPEAFRRGLHRAVGDCLAAVSTRHPVVLAIEDVHWIDASSASLTAELLPMCRGTPILFLLSGRPEARPILEGLATAGDIQRSTAIEVGPLDEAATRTMIERLLGDDPPSTLIAAVNERTAGNPFFIQEMVWGLQDSGDLFLRDDVWCLASEWDASQLPATIEGMLAARIDLLPHETGTVLQAAAVIGRQVRLPVLRAIATDVDDLDGHLERLVNGGFFDPIVDQQGTLLFHHGLVLDVAYGRIVRRRRRFLHRAVADAAERLYGAGDDTIDLLARHLYLGGAGGRALPYLRRAGERARRLFANSEAITHFGRAAEVLAEDSEASQPLSEMELELASLYHLVGDYDAAAELYAKVRTRAGDVRAWLGLANIYRHKVEYTRALSVLEDAFAIPDLDPAMQASLWLARAQVLRNSGRANEAIDASERGLSVAPEDSLETGLLLMELAQTEDEAGRFEVALAHALSAREIIHEKGDAATQVTITRLLGGIYEALDRLDDAVATLRTGLAEAERVGNAEEIGACLINLGQAEMKRGNLDEALACDRRAALEFKRIGHIRGHLICQSNLVEKLIDVGQLVEADALCESTLALVREAGDPLLVAPLMYYSARLRLLEGDARQAALHAETAANLARENGTAWPLKESLELAASAWDVCGEPELAEAFRLQARSEVSAESVTG